MVPNLEKIYFDNILPAIFSNSQN